MEIMLFMCVNMDEIMRQPFLQRRLVDDTPTILRQVFNLLKMPFEVNTGDSRESRDALRVRCITYLSDLFDSFKTGEEGLPTSMSVTIVNTSPRPTPDTVLQARSDLV